MVDYYEVLNVSRSASQGEIKRAYKALALQWHPDKNQGDLEEANKRFRELSEAYQVLSDAKKRQEYDLYGNDEFLRDLRQQSSSTKQPPDYDVFNPIKSAFVFRNSNDVFRDIFGAISPFAKIFGHVQSFAAPVTVPVVNFGVPTVGFTSFSNFGNGFTGGFLAATSSGTSTTTSFVNGKKITTKRVFENGRETILTYENDALKTKSVNGVAQKVPGIKNKRTSTKPYRKH